LLIAWWCKIDNESEDPVGGTKFLTSGLDAWISQSFLRYDQGIDQLKKRRGPV
jgi:hypothetical protein